MQESNVQYFKNLNKLLIYCDTLTEDKISRTYIDKQVLVKFPQLKKFSKDFKEIEIKEDKKNLDTVSKIWEDMFEKSIQRSSTVLCIGGGVLSDAVGFASSTYKRGTGLVIIPTTLLSMVDAAHGGKNGINTTHGKNQIGTFMMPDQVLICPEFLRELPEKQIKNGLIELIKAGFLKSPKLVQQVYETDISKVNIELIKAAVDIKNEIIKNDFKESSERMYLNFGHTIGHLIEVDSKHSIPHGEAVGIGILKALKISEKMCNLDKNISDHFENFLKKLDLNVDYKFSSNPEQLKELLFNDKKFSKDIVKYVLLENIGNPVLVDFNLNDLLNEVTYA